MGFGYTERGFVMPRYKTVTASGNPLTLQNAKRLRKLTIYGNAVQDGTPSPDAPVEVQLCGDKTGNLYDVNDKYKTWNTAVTDDAGWIIINFDNSFGDSEYWTSCFTKYRDVIEPNIQYTLVTEIEYISGGTIYATSRATDNNISPFNTHVVYSTAGTYCCTVTSKSNLSDCNVLLRTFGCIGAGDTLTAKFRISLLKGSYTAETIPDYEPYGYKVSGRVEGVNLFDKSNVTLGYRLYQDGQLHPQDEGNEQFVSDYISVEGNTQYYYNATTNWDTRLCEYDINKSLLVQHDQSYNVFTDIFTTSENTAYVRFTRPQSQMDMTMISKGSEAQPYEPYQPPQDFAVYLPQQIAKVGDVADTVVVDFEKRTAELVQRTITHEITGNEHSSLAIGDDYFIFSSYLGKRPMIGTRKCFCNICVSKNASTNNPTVSDDIYIFESGSSNYYIHFYVPKDKYATVDDFKSYLQQMYADGTPVCALYAVTTVTTDITAMQDWDAMPQVKGTVTLTMSAEVEPSGAEAVYISSRSPKPKAQTIADVVINEADPEHTEASGPEQTDEAAALNIEMITYE